MEIAIIAHDGMKAEMVQFLNKNRTLLEAADVKLIATGTTGSKAEKAGFKFAGSSEVNANPKDTTDWPEGVWTLPPTLALGDKDKEMYVAIGESDRMTLRFVKPKR